MEAMKAPPSSQLPKCAVRRIAPRFEVRIASSCSAPWTLTRSRMPSGVSLR